MDRHSPTNQQSKLRLFLENIDQIDCSLFLPGRGVIGVSWSLDLVAKGDIHENGFICDFSVLKAVARKAMRATIDHCLVVGADTSHQSFGSFERWQLDKDWAYRCPVGCVYVLPTNDVSVAAIEHEIGRIVTKALHDPGVTVEAKLHELTSAGRSLFQYTHGITGHKGMCQRPLHGHSSHLEVLVDNARHTSLEHKIISQYFSTSIHLASPNQFQKNHLWEPGQRGPENRSAHIYYEGSHGVYEVELPADKVLLLPQDTSIECLTQFLARQIKKSEFPTATIQVTCREGINKGAIATE